MAETKFHWDPVWTAVSAVASAVAALAAVYAVTQVNEARREERAANHPTFQFTTARFDRNTDGQTYRFLFTFTNTGGRAATALTEEFWLFELGKPMPGPARNAVANAILRNEPFTWQVRPLSMGSDFPPQFGVIRLRYSDAEFGGTFEQTFYVKWAGIKGGKFEGGVEHATPEERDQIIKQLPASSAGDPARRDRRGGE